MLDTTVRARRRPALIVARWARQGVTRHSTNCFVLLHFGASALHDNMKSPGSSINVSLRRTLARCSTPSRPAIAAAAVLALVTLNYAYLNANARRDLISPPVAGLRGNNFASAFVPLQEFEDHCRAASSGRTWESVFFFFITRGWAEEAGDVRSKLFLDSLFLHHPEARVLFVATTEHRPSPSLLDSYTRLGYSLHGVHLPVSELPRSGWWLSDDNRAWLEEQSASSDAKFFFTHLTDYLRFFLLHRHGGTYTDSDSIFVQPLPPAGEFIGLDVDAGDDAPRYDWFIDYDKRTYAAPGVMRLARGNAVARAALLQSFTPAAYERDCFSCVGPKALSEQVKAAIQAIGEAPPLLEPHTLYPLPWRQAAKLFAANGFKSAPLYLERLRRNSLAVHLFGGATRELTIEPGSVVALLAEQQSLAAVGRGDTAEGGACTFSAPDLAVARNGSATTLTGAYAVFLRACAGWNDGAAATLTVSAARGQLRSGADGTWQRSVRLPALYSVAAVNAELSLITYDAGGPGAEPLDDGIDTLALSLQLPDESLLASASVDVGVFNRLVTVMTHTNGRSRLVAGLYASIQERFPGTELLVSDDSAPGHEIDGRPPLGTYMRWVPVPADCGLSLARNTLVAAARTPYVYLLDDDFVLGENSHLDVLLQVLHATGFDIASALIPADVESLVDFRGLVDATETDLRLRPGNKGQVHGCLHVEFTPNVFMGRRASLMRSPWDPELKLGEHEDFFLRAKQAGFRVLSCDYVEVVHKQDKWWVPSETKDAVYADRRRRVYEFMKRSLQKHGLQRLNSFGIIITQVGDGL